jgi:hypothetical protein
MASQVDVILAPQLRPTSMRRRRRRRREEVVAAFNRLFLALCERATLQNW